MEERDEEDNRGFTGFGLGLIPQARAEEGVFILAVYREGTLAASAHATEHGAMAAATAFLDDQSEDDIERATLEDLFVRAQRSVADDGGLMEIIPSPISGD